MKSLPSGSNAYDDAYKDAMDRIEGQLLDQKVLAWQVLSWITCAKRPLTMSELQHALAIELGESSLDEDNLPQIEDMVSVCAGLVTVDRGGEIIRLVHYTTQEYFERTKETWFPNLEVEVTKLCVTYLSFDTFESGICEDHRALEERLQLNQFYNYASRNWGHHAREAFISIPEVHSFLERNAQVQASIQVLLGAHPEFLGTPRYSQSFQRGLTALHLAAYFGLEKTARHLVRTSAPDEKDGGGWTPLLWAASNGHEAVAKLLLENNAEVDIKGIQSQTPLVQAARHGHEAVIKLLLMNNANIDLQGPFNHTALTQAIEKGNEAVMKLLILNNANINLKGIFGHTPLSITARDGKEAAFKLLLMNNAKVNTGDYLSESPLSYAATYGYEVIVKLLLMNNADVNSRDETGRTPLSNAAEKGREAVVKLLLAYNARIDLEDEHKKTPLMYAVEGEHEAVVKLLLEHQAEMNLKGITYDKAPLVSMREDEPAEELL